MSRAFTGSSADLLTATITSINTGGWICGNAWNNWVTWLATGNDVNESKI